jgi:hypothetical protein
MKPKRDEKQGDSLEMVIIWKICFHNKSLPTGHCFEEDYAVMQGVVLSLKEKGMGQVEGMPVFLVGR